MPSPFPGMDPFLEDRVIFPDLHDRLTNHISEALQSQLPAPYFAAMASYTWIEVDNRYVMPDVNVLHRNGGGESEPAQATATMAVKTRTSPVVVHVPHDERKHSYVEICTPAEGGRLVAVIEVLSPSNKAAGELSRELYLRKQREIVYSNSHLIEIDLLRGGEHSTAVPLERLQNLVGEFDYHVCLHRADETEDYFVYPFLLTQPLPEIAVPLLPGDGEVALDLQAVFERCYSAGAYRRRVTYDPKFVPAPILSEARQAWLAERIVADASS